MKKIKKKKKAIIHRRKTTIHLGKSRQETRVNESEKVNTIIERLSNNEKIVYRQSAFKMRVSRLPTYNAIIDGDEIVIPTTNVYIPKNHYTKKQYREAMKFAINIIEAKNG